MTCLLRLGSAVMVCLALALPARGATPAPRPIGPQDKCPVCGMFVAKFPDFAAQIQFRGGQTVNFDGAKDMFRYYLDLKKYAPGKKGGDIAALYVTDYYDLTMVDGFRASYVLGSSVYGPMGRELIPVADPAKAAGFLKDHQGKSVHRFQEITPALLKRLE